MTMLLPEREEGGMLSLARVIEQAGAMGWDWFNQLPAGATTANAAAKAQEIALTQRLAQACARLGDNADFVLLLEHLVDTTIMQPVQYVALGLPIDQTALNAARREGENALVWKILKLVREGRAIPLARAEEEKSDVSPVQLDDGPSAS